MGKRVDGRANMRPVAFLTSMANNDENTPAGAIQRAMNMGIIIRSDALEWKTLSYYYSEKDKCMVLDIEPINSTYEEGWNAYVAFIIRDIEELPKSSFKEFIKGLAAAKKAANKRDIDWL